MRFIPVIFFSLIFLLSSGCSTPTRAIDATADVPQPSSTDGWLSANEAHADILLARKLYAEIHPGYTRYTDRAVLDQAWSALLTRAEQPMTTDTLFGELSKILALIRCDHTKAEMPDQMRQSRLESPSYFPFRLMLSGEDAYIYSSLPQTGLKKGDRIIAIDGRVFEVIRRTVFNVIPYDGRTHFIRSSEFESSSEFLGSAFETFYPVFFGAWEQATVSIERNGEVLSFTIDPIDWTSWRGLDWKGRPYRSDFRDSVALTTIEPGIATLRIDTFVNYRRPVDPDEIYRPIFERLARDGVHTLILDTRYNGGGSTDASTGLLSYLVDESTPMFESKKVRTIDLSEFSDYIRTYDPSALTPDPSRFISQQDGWFDLRRSSDPIALDPIELKTPRFDGKVIALSSISNASGVTLLLAMLQEKVGATILGEPTGGSSEGPTAGTLFFAELPNSQITLRIPWQLQLSAISEPLTGLGVLPDIEIVPSIADRLADRDPQLDAAIEMAKKENPNEIR